MQTGQVPAAPGRVITIEGRRVLVVDRRPPVPPTLHLLLNGGRDATGRPWAALRVATHDPIALGGTRPDCLREDHRLRRWLQGFHTGSDGVVRFLHLQACADCGAVCVRDQSIDTLDRVPVGRRPPRRRDHVIGWYTGARPNQRIYT